MSTASAAAGLAGTRLRELRARALWLVPAAVVALGAPFSLSDYHVFQLTQVVVYAIAVLGLNLLTGFSGQISLGNGAFYALGAYSAVIAMTHAGVPYWATPPLAGALCFAAGYLFGRSAARLEGLYLALATFALAITTPQLLKLDALERWTGGNQGVVIDKPVSPIPALFNHDRWLYFFCLAVAILLFTGAWNVVRGRTGRALIALRDHPIAAGAMGIDVAAYKATVFGVSAMFTGIAGALGALLSGFVAPDSFQLALSIQLLVGVVVGGIASIGGTVFGAVFIEVVPDLTKHASEVSPALGWLADVQYPMYGVLLIVTVLVLPGGVAGAAAVVRHRLTRSGGHASGAPRSAL